MRSEYGKALRRLFESELKIRAPEFVPTKVDAEFLFPGECAFCHIVDTQLWLWVLVVPSVKRDDFNIEIGWSRLSRFPRNKHPYSGETERTLALTECMCRLGIVAGRGDVWWNIDGFMRSQDAKQILAAMPGALQSNPETRVHVSVIAAVSLLVSHGISFLARVT